MTLDKFYTYWIAFFRRKIREIPKKKPSEIFAVLSTIVVPGVVAYFSATDKLASFFVRFITFSKDGAPIQADITFNKYFAASIIFVLLLAVLSTLAALFSKNVAIKKYQKAFNKLRVSAKEINKNYNTLRSAYDSISRQAGQIRYQSSDEPLSYNFTKHHTIYDINEHGDVEVIKDIEIQAGAEYVKTWLLFIDGFPHAEDAPVFSDIDLQVTCPDGNACAVLPLMDGPKRKEMLIFFLPELEPQKKRQLRISYKWPKMFLGLKQGREELFWSNAGRHRNRKTDFRSELRIARSLGNIIAEIAGPKPAGTQLDISHAYEKTMIVYQVPNMPCDSATYSLELKVNRT